MTTKLKDYDHEQEEPYQPTLEWRRVLASPYGIGSSRLAECQEEHRGTGRKSGADDTEEAGKGAAFVEVRGA